MKRHRLLLLFLFLAATLGAPRIACDDDDAPSRRNYDSYVACVRACPGCDCEVYR